MRKNEHIEHLEDLMFFSTTEAKESLDEIISLVEGNASGLKWSHKIDGSPAVVLYNNFKGLPKGSGVCLKYMNPEKCYRTNEEIEEQYGDRETMCDMLQLCLILATQIPEGEAWQGDCLFTDRTLRKEEINGEEFVIWQPNKVAYCAKAGSDDANAAEGAMLGIAFHTRYTGSLAELSQDFNINTDWFDGDRRFYLMKVDAEPLFKVKDVDALKSQVSDIKGKIDKHEEDIEFLCDSPIFEKVFKPAENYFLNTRGDANLNSKKMLEKMKSLINEKGSQKDLKDLASIMDMVEPICEIINDVINFKKKVIRDIVYDEDDIETLYQTKNGYEDSDNGEGYVVSRGDRIFKVIDRQDFSAKNRNEKYLSGFKHEKAEIKDKIKRKLIEVIQEGCVDSIYLETQLDIDAKPAKF